MATDPNARIQDDSDPRRCVVRRLRPGDADGFGNVFLLWDPAAALGSDPAAAAYVGPTDDGVVEITVTAGADADVLARLLVTVLDALRAMGLRRVISRPDGLPSVATALARLGLARRGMWLELEL